MTADLQLRPDSAFAQRLLDPQTPLSLVSGSFEHMEAARRAGQTLLVRAAGARAAYKRLVRGGCTDTAVLEPARVKASTLTWHRAHLLERIYDLSMGNSWLHGMDTHGEGTELDMQANADRAAFLAAYSDVHRIEP